MMTTTESKDEPGVNLDALRFSYDAQLAERVFATFGRPALGAAPQTSALLDMRRRHLLGDAVLITHDLLPEIARAFAQCLRALGISEKAGGLYVQQCAEYNANVMSDGERFDIVVNSGLLKDFSTPELRFVIGHELGHVLYAHNDISLRGLFEAHEQIPYEEAMLLFRWSRSAEISADRVGLVCAGGSEPAVSAMFKLSSGLSGVPIEAVRASMRHQFEQLKQHIADASTEDDNDLVRTHPMSPIRFRSIELATRHIAAIFASASGTKPASLVKLDQNIEALLEAIESDAPASRGFVAAAGQEMLCRMMVFVAMASGMVSGKHRAFMQQAIVALGGSFRLDGMLREADGCDDWQAFRARQLDALDACVEAELLTRDELARAVALVHMMVHDGALGHPPASFQIALSELMTSLKVAPANLPVLRHARGMSASLVREVLDVGRSPQKS